MMTLRQLGKRRYVGDKSTMDVHDRWHADCEGCLLDQLVESGHAVGFEPDTLDGALNEGFDTCPHCFDKTDPPRPEWAGGGLDDTPDSTDGGRGTQGG